MMHHHILIVEDDDAIQELMVFNLSKEGFRTTVAPSAEEAQRKLRIETLHAVILDLMLPGMSGLELCRLIKRDPAWQQIPIIMVSAKGAEADIVTGLELGADDYMVKPFSPRVLIARIKSVLRRKVQAPSDDELPLTIHGLTIDPGRHCVMSKSGGMFELTNMEFRVFHFLASRPGWVFTRYQIVNAVRGDNYPVTDRAVDVLIVGLRKKLGSYGEYIETVRGVGYRCREEKE
jgi:two-component system alkaline phosphatase synthesis response regulator PhoP